MNESHLKFYILAERVGVCDSNDSAARVQIFTQDFVWYVCVIVLATFLGLSMVYELLKSMSNIRKCRGILNSGAMDTRLNERLKAKVRV